LGVPTQLKRLHALITRGLDKTAGLWPDIEVACGWVHRAGHLLANEAKHPSEQVQGDYKELLAQMQAYRLGQEEEQGPETGSMERPTSSMGSMKQWVDQFLKVTASYWEGLFACYGTPDLPQTNNELEQCFGKARYHERRATGRKQTSGMLVVRGRVRLVAAVGTMTQVKIQGEGFRAQDLGVGNGAQREEWRALRAQLEYRQATRRAQYRFRRDPGLYLSKLETLLLKPTLPP
jgi:hypothetical protein